MNLEKLNIRMCPKCGNGVQKNGGCLHMTCKCGGQFCWTCGKAFNTAKECNDHLVKEHKGIFDSNYM